MADRQRIVAELHHTESAAHPGHSRADGTNTWVRCEREQLITRNWLRILRRVGVVIAVRVENGTEIPLGELMQQYQRKH